MFKQYVCLKKNRFRKKFQTYKRLMTMSFDVTITFYTVAFIGYVIFAFVRTGGIDTSAFFGLFKWITTLNITCSSVLTFLPFVFLIRAFRHAGMVITSSEYTLLYLPHTQRQLLQLTFVERIVKTCLLVLFGATIVYFILPIFWSVAAPFIGAYVIVAILMTHVEWKFFQLSFVWKLAIILLALLTQLLHVVIDVQVFAFIVFIFLFFLNILLYRRRMLRIDWQKVTAFSDFHVWNMPLISHVTKVKWQKERHYPLWHRMTWWKRPFRYERRALYSRLIFIHLEKHIKTIVQFLGATLFLLCAAIFIHKLIFFIALIFVAIAYKSFVIALLRSLLYTGIVAHLPWRLETYIRSFYRWTIILFLPQLIPLVVFMWKFFEGLTIASVVVIIIVIIFYIKRALYSFPKQWKQKW